MAASIASLGITPASLFGVALTITMNRIDLSKSLSTGRSLSGRPLYLSNANRGIRHIFQKAFANSCDIHRPLANEAPTNDQRRPYRRRAYGLGAPR
jgi:hypothetical protein